MILADIISDIAATSITASSKVALMRLAIADSPMSTKELTAALNIDRAVLNRALQYPIAKGWVRKRGGRGRRGGGGGCTYELTNAAIGTVREAA